SRNAGLSSSAMGRAWRPSLMVVQERRRVPLEGGRKSALERVRLSSTLEMWGSESDRGEARSGVSFIGGTSILLLRDGRPRSWLSLGPSGLGRALLSVKAPRIGSAA